MINFAGEITGTWSLGSSYVKFYFVEEYSDYKEMIASKEKVDTDLKKAKSIIQIGGTSDYYHAVKAYYTTVKALHSLVYNYPEGYSLLTYSNAIQQAQSECNKAYAEVELYFGS